MIFSAGVALIMQMQAATEQTPLPVPAGHVVVAGANAPIYVNTKSVRSNMVAGERSTSANVLAFAKSSDGVDLYAVNQMVARCQSKKLARTRIVYFTADQKAVRQNEEYVEIYVKDNTDDAAIYAQLCSDWEQYD